MTTPFDLVTGNLQVDSTTLTASMTPEDVARLGFTFVKQFDMKMGAIIRTIGPEAFGGHRVNVSLLFRNDHLERADLLLLDAPSLDEVALFGTHTDFLRRELGPPTTTSDHNVVYEYPWGSISSIYDPRGGGSYIIVGWGTPIA